jgi:hypothetical protein
MEKAITITTLQGGISPLAYLFRGKILAPLRTRLGVAAALGAGGAGGVSCTLALRANSAESL